MSVMQIPGHEHQKPGEVMLEEIENILGNCKRCELGQTRSHIVFGCGNPHARVMFVGEGPGRNEDLKGEPFVGAAATGSTPCSPSPASRARRSTSPTS